MKFRIVLLLFSLLCFPALAEPTLIPDLTFSGLNGNPQKLRAQEYQVLLVPKPGKDSRTQNMEWMEPLTKAFQKKETRVWLVADLSSRPRFASQDRVKEKISSETGTQKGQFLLLDWDGKLRKELDLDSQHHVYLLGPGGEILAHEVGLYNQEKLEKLLKAR